MKLNLKVRFKNPVFIFQIVMSVLFPILGYMGLTVEDITTWKVLGDTLLEAIMNPYVLGIVAVSVYNALTDPTSKGFRDTKAVLELERPIE